MLANANIKTLEEEEDEEIDAQENLDLEANRKRRIQKHDKADTLTSQQMNQVWCNHMPSDCLLSLMQHNTACGWLALRVQASEQLRKRSINWLTCQIWVICTAVQSVIVLMGHETHSAGRAYSI